MSLWILNNAVYISLVSVPEDYLNLANREEQKVHGHIP